MLHVNLPFFSVLCLFVGKNKEGSSQIPCFFSLVFLHNSTISIWTLYQIWDQEKAIINIYIMFVIMQKRNFSNITEDNCKLLTDRFDDFLLEVLEVNTMAVITLFFLETLRSIDVTCVPEEVIRCHLYHVRGEVPHICSVINDANHVVSTRKQGAVSCNTI